MRALAMTGIVTASWISRILSGSAMRATPPWARMSAGTRSRAMTATAPASSAIFAWSAVTTSMMTPPLSISASPRLTRAVPVTWLLGSMWRTPRLSFEPLRAAHCWLLFCLLRDVFWAPRLHQLLACFNAARRTRKEGGAAGGPNHSAACPRRGTDTRIRSRAWALLVAPALLLAACGGDGGDGGSPAPAGQGHRHRVRIRQAGQVRCDGPGQARSDRAAPGQQHQGAGRVPDRPAGRGAHPGRVLPGHRDRGAGADPDLAARLRWRRRDVARPDPQRGRRPQGGHVRLVLQ